MVSIMRARSACFSRSALRPTLRPTPRPSLRSGAFSPVFLLALACTLGATFAVSGVAAADEPPLVLSGEHLGMSADEIAATQSGPEPTAEDAKAEGTGSEFVSVEPGEATDCAAATTAQAGMAVTGFGQCVEASIRGGVGFEASARVCRALFPENG